MHVASLKLTISSTYRSHGAVIFVPAAL